jgi:predicted permease
LPWAIAAGAAWRLTGLSLPGPVDQVVRMLGDAATPVALFTIGAVLWRSGRPRYAAFEDAEWKSTGGTLHRPQPRRAAEAAEAAKPERERRRKPGAVPLGRYLPVAAIKLFLHPLLVLLFCAAAHQLGAPLTVLQISALVLAAALPSAANVSLLAERYGADNGRIAHIIMASTAASFVTLSTLAWLLGARPQL